MSSKPKTSDGSSQRRSTRLSGKFDSLRKRASINNLLMNDSVSKETPRTLIENICKLMPAVTPKTNVLRTIETPKPATETTKSKKTISQNAEKSFNIDSFLHPSQRSNLNNSRKRKQSATETGENSKKSRNVESSINDSSDISQVEDSFVANCPVVLKRPQSKRIKFNKPSDTKRKEFENMLQNKLTSHLESKARKRNISSKSGLQKKNQELEFSNVDDSIDSSQNSNKERDTVESDIEADVEDEVEEDSGEKNGGARDGGGEDGEEEVGGEENGGEEVGGEEEDGEEEDGGGEDGGGEDGGARDGGEKEDGDGRKDDQIEENDHRRSGDQGDQHSIEGDKDPNNDQDAGQNANVSNVITSTLKDSQLVIRHGKRSLIFQHPGHSDSVASDQSDIESRMQQKLTVHQLTQSSHVESTVPSQTTDNVDLIRQYDSFVEAPSHVGSVRSTRQSRISDLGIDRHRSSFVPELLQSNGSRESLDQCNLETSLQHNTNVGSQQNNTNVGSQQNNTNVGYQQNNTNFGSQQNNTNVGSQQNNTFVGSQQNNTNVGPQQNNTFLGSPSMQQSRNVGSPSMQPNGNVSSLSQQHSSLASTPRRNYNNRRSTAHPVVTFQESIQEQRSSHLESPRQPLGRHSELSQQNHQSIHQSDSQHQSVDTRHGSPQGSRFESRQQPLLPTNQSSVYRGDNSSNDEADASNSTFRLMKLAKTPVLPPKQTTPSTVKASTNQQPLQIGNSTTTVGQRQKVPTRNGTQRRRQARPVVPTAILKAQLNHFTGMKFSKEALEKVEEISETFWSNITRDLQAYCEHGKRSVVDCSDVELLMRRERLITDNESLQILIEKYLPLESREELIPIARSGNRIELKKN